MLPSRSFRFIDLFAGLGGFHVALQRLGGEAVFAAEWKPELQDLYERNFGLRPAGDINAVDPKDIPDHEVLAAGFPCQPFSKAGERLGFEHTEQGKLFFSVLHVLQEKQPELFILENVPNLLGHNKGETFRFMVEQLEQLGYHVDHHKYSPHQFGIPQIRDRVYIVGSRSGLDHHQWPIPTGAEPDVRSVLQPGVSAERKLNDKVLRVLEMWADFLRRTPDDVPVPGFPLWTMEFGATYEYERTTPFAILQAEGAAGFKGQRGVFGARLSEVDEQAVLADLPAYARRPDKVFPAWKQEFIRKNRDFYRANKSWINPWMREWRLKELPASFQKFEWHAQGEERDLWKYVIQTRPSGVRVKRPTTAPSLIAMTDSQVPIIGWERRYMSVLECARLQSLESIRMPDVPAQAYRALGNAVNAQVVSEICRMLVGNLAPITRADRVPSAEHELLLMDQAS